MGNENTNWGQSVTGVVIKMKKYYWHATHMAEEKECLLFLVDM